MILSRLVVEQTLFNQELTRLPYLSSQGTRHFLLSIACNVISLGLLQFTTIEGRSRENFAESLVHPRGMKRLCVCDASRPGAEWAPGTCFQSQFGGSTVQDSGCVELMKSKKSLFTRSFLTGVMSNALSTFLDDHTNLSASLVMWTEPDESAAANKAVEVITTSLQDAIVYYERVMD